jgi:cell division transport system permease protein
MRLLHAVGYCFEEALIELWRNRLVNVVSIATIAVSLFILGIFASISSNLNLLLAGWANRVQVTAYVADQATEQLTEDLKKFLDGSAKVDSFRYISKEEAIERFRSYFPSSGLTDMLDSNPLPASFEIQVAPVGHRTRCGRSPTRSPAGPVWRRWTTICSGSRG